MAFRRTYRQRINNLSIEWRAESSVASSPRGGTGCLRRRLATATTPLSSEADFFGKHSALLGVVWGDHRIILREIPFGSIVVGRHAEVGHQVATHHRKPLTVLKADEIIRLDRCADRYRRLLLLDLLFLRPAKSCQCAMNPRNQVGKIGQTRDPCRRLPPAACAHFQPRTISGASRGRPASAEGVRTDYRPAVRGSFPLIGSVPWMIHMEV